MADIDKRTLSAIHNNWDWYQAEFTTWGITYQRTTNAWYTFDAVPPFHSNLLWLGQAFPEQLLAQLREKKRGQRWSVNDTLALHDFTDFGLEVLFEAQWYFREVSQANQVSVTKVDSDEAFSRWIDAWGESNDVFHRDLWQQANVGFLSAGDGGIAYNRSADRIGVSNFWGHESAIQDCIQHLAAYALPLVGYERSETAHLLVNAGFQATGPLRVWVSKESK